MYSNNISYFVTSDHKMQKFWFSVELEVTSNTRNAIELLPANVWVT